MVTHSNLRRANNSGHRHSRLGSALTDCALLLSLAAIASMVLVLSVVLLGKWLLGSAVNGCYRSARAIKGPVLRQTLARLPARSQTLRRQ